jgi:hypothetical protein
LTGFCHAIVVETFQAFAIATNGRKRVKGSDKDSISVKTGYRKKMITHTRNPSDLVQFRPSALYQTGATVF